MGYVGSLAMGGGCRPARPAFASADPTRAYVCHDRQLDRSIGSTWFRAPKFSELSLFRVDVASSAACSLSTAAAGIDVVEVAAPTIKVSTTPISPRC
jgi:hypothetical protein